MERQQNQNNEQKPRKWDNSISLALAVSMLLVLASIIFIVVIGETVTEDVVFLYFSPLTNLFLVLLIFFLCRKIRDMGYSVYLLKKESSRNRNLIEKLFREVQSLDDRIESIRLESGKIEKMERWERTLDNMERNRNYRRKTRRPRRHSNPGMGVTEADFFRIDGKDDD